MNQIWEIKLAGDTPEEAREAMKLVSRMSMGINRANGREYEYLHDMLERYAELMERSAGVWVPVGERLPKEPGEYLCLHNNPKALSHSVMLDFGGRTKWHCAKIWNPTHWLDVRLPNDKETTK